MSAINDRFISRLRTKIGNDRLVPIIGDTVRDEDIFDVDGNNRLEILGNEIEPLWDEAGYSKAEWNHFSITEKLAALWAQELEYPMPDRYKMERVGLFQAVCESHEEANEQFLRFRKVFLLKVAQHVATVEKDEETLALIKALKESRQGPGARLTLDRLTFSDLAVELDFPRYPEGYEDPLRVLARQPLSTYVTTDHHDFLERALRKENKTPHTRLCWPRDEPDLRSEHAFDDNYEPTIENPIVYHLCGYEEYPQSLVVSEDSYLDLLVRLTEEDPQDQGDPTMPIFLQDKVRDSSLLLLGYRFRDWDFRVVIRSMLRLKAGRARRNPNNFAIQLDLGANSELSGNEDEVREYLESYFQLNRFVVQFGPIDDILQHL